MSNFSFPSSGQSVTKGPKRQSAREKNLSQVQANRHALGFMLITTPGGKEALYNKRSRLPSAKRIVAFNRKRGSHWSTGGSDMRTSSEQRWSKASKPSLRKMKLSRNHKIPDSLLGSMINRAVISSTIGDSKQRKRDKQALLQFGGKMLKPLDHSQRQVAFNAFKQRVDRLTDYPLNKTSYTKHFDAAKRVLSGSLGNLRLGSSPVNSGIGDSLDLNVVQRPQILQRPPSPISQHMYDAVDQWHQDTHSGPTTGLFPTLSPTTRATSSFTKR